MSAETEQPDSSAVRVALWRALHVQLDAAPPVLADEVGLQLADPPDGWRDRPDMDPMRTRGFRAAIVARARFIEELVAAEAEKGVDQYVLLGGGLDTFAQRRRELAERLQVYEVDRPGAQAWKARRLVALGYAVPPWHHLVPFDFEGVGSWWDTLVTAGFDERRPAVVASTGVAMYLTNEANVAALRQLARLASGSTVAMSFLVPIELVAPEDRPGLEASAAGAKASGTPFVSFYRPEEMVAMACDAGFRDAEHVAGSVLAERWFRDRADGLRPSTGEDLLVART